MKRQISKDSHKRKLQEKEFRELRKSMIQIKDTKNNELKLKRFMNEN